MLYKLQKIIYNSFEASTRSTRSSEVDGDGDGDGDGTRERSSASLSLDSALGGRFQAHITIAKTSKIRMRHKNAKLLPEYYEGLGRFLESVSCEMLTVDLLSMVESDEHGYYKCYASYNLSI